MTKLLKIISDRILVKNDILICRIKAPLYWWQGIEIFANGITNLVFDSPEEIAKDELTLDDFSTDDMFERSIVSLESTLNVLNYYRSQYKEEDVESTASKKEYLQQIVKLLPSSYYATGKLEIYVPTLRFIRKWYKDSPIKEWSEFFKCLKNIID